jgi:hypothetical protein
MKYVLLIIAVGVMLIPTSTTPKPNPILPEVTSDALDTCHNSYRILMSDVWAEYATQRSSFKTDVEALTWINTHQTAAYSAAYDPFIQRAIKESASTGNPQSLADDLKNHKL